jgi:two-component system sensor kinase FixL
MASGIAHELNQPLCAIANYSGACLRLLKKENGISEKVLGSLEKIKSQAVRAGKIISRLRRMVTRNLPTISNVDINDTIE